MAETASAAGRSDHDLALQRARKRVKELRALYGSAATYVAVMSVLWTINALTIDRAGNYWWAIWPTLGWGGGLGIWAITFYLSAHGGIFGHAWEEQKVQELMARANLKRVSSEKQLMQAQLRLLQAQIEPHFLFNTLANVQSLIKRQPDTAQSMLDSFITYLRQSLAASRQTQGTLGQEVSLLRHYLELLKMRMGPRLSYQLDVAEALHGLPLAPMLLQPLVENAIRHGLEPNVSGGHVRVQATRQADWLHIEVQDNGLGFVASQVLAERVGSVSGATAGTGVGLQNLRERLAVLYQGQASIEMQEADPGTLVRLKLPVEQA